MAARDRWLSSLALFAGLVLATLVVYQPAWFGTPLWDDDAHMTRAGLRSLDGLRQIWFDPRATQQYYPLTHSAFWLMHRLWGDAPLGYHLANMLLHASSAFLLSVLLRRLAVPGAMFAAFLFALHPVQVESVAWITELKNTQSTFFYLLSALFYIQFDEDRRRSRWWIAAGFFALALMTKTVAATLPVSLLAVMWWKRGRLELKRDVLPLVPFVIIGVAAGIGTAWVERTFIIGTASNQFNFSPIERILIAGRAAWFYATKLIWPVNLMFTYPRWSIDQSAAWQYLFPASLALLLAWLWSLRARTRGPLAAAALYLIALGPALGFVNIFPFIYSFVADHFQYTASLAAFAAIAAGTTIVMRKVIASLAVRHALATVALVPLAFITWQLSHQYVSAETLYRSTIARNPSAWMAHQNLGAFLMGAGTDLDGAEAHFRESLRLHADNAEAHNNLGYLFDTRGRREDALKEYQEAIRLNPGLAAARNNLGALEHTAGHFEVALEHYRAALTLDPNYWDARRNIALVLLDLGRVEEAAPYAEELYRLDPRHPDSLDAMGTLALRRGRLEDAIAYYEAALPLRPPTPYVLVKLGLVYERAGRRGDAAAKYNAALAADDSFAPALDALGYLELREGQYTAAVTHLQRAIALQPALASAHASLGGALQAVGRLDESIAAFRRALEFRENAESAGIHNAFGVSLAQRGRIPEAIAQFREALRLDPSLRDAQENLARASRK